MKRKVVILAVSLGALGAGWIGVAQSAPAAKVPPICVHHPIPGGQIEVGYCPNG
ncbi:MAG TPA: hypothetical protein VKI19_04785 [Acidimicrobiales bacterium]|nr:hypothetical protein [Acidimicrobiales bacterium]